MEVFMFVYNLKINGNILLKSILFFIVSIALVILILSALNLFKSTNSNNNTIISTNNTISIETSNYTELLEEVYNNIDKYVGKNINFTRVCL